MDPNSNLSAADYPPFDFEGRRVPAADGLPEALGAEADRPWLIRAAVVYPPVAEAAVEVAERWLRGDDPGRWVIALDLAGALMARRLVGCLAERLPALTAAAPELAVRALDLLVRLAPPSHAAKRDALRWALAEPTLRVRAWSALGADDPDAVLPHLAELLIAEPGLAGEVGRRFALVHTPLCHAAAEALAPLPEATRRAFAKELEKHLKRIFQVRRWAECRRILFGK